MGSLGAFRAGSVRCRAAAASPLSHACWLALALLANAWRVTPRCYAADHGTNHSTCHTDWVGCLNGPKAAAYIAEWVEGAKRVHGVHVSYIGWHNESPWRPEWVAALREELDKRGLTTTQIVVGDCGPGGGFQSPGLAAKLQPNASVDLSKIADVVGLHYPVSIMPVAKEPNASPGALKNACLIFLR